MPIPPSENSAAYRTERDSMGDMRVPKDALYGPQTQRAVENFPISELRFPRAFIHALGLIKSVAAKINSGEMAQDIERAAEEVASGKHDDQFVVDIFQTGSGTSTNMNANEVIGHLAKAHPNDQVNRSQSSNDVIPSAMHVASAIETNDKLLPALRGLEDALKAKAGEFKDVVKIGRTHLQDAVPMTLGQEFSGYAAQIGKCQERILSALAGLYELPLGGTAIGTGLNAPPNFGRDAIAEIAKRTRLRFVEAPNHFEAQASKDAVSFFSGALRTCAIALTKIANDIRWLASFGEVEIPATQPGSSIMPGKVNPVIAESLLMVCAQVIGYDATIAWCCAAGNFELNVMMPVMAYDLLQSIDLLANASRNFSERCIQGLLANPSRAGAFVEQSLSMGTVLAPEIGYDKAAAIAKEAHATGRTIREIAREKSGLSEDQLNALLDPRKQAG
jgi:fumarate hydratase class II